MELKEYKKIKNLVIDRGYQWEIEMVEKLLENPCRSADHFSHEAIWVICNSGMKNQIAEKIFKKVMTALTDKVKIISVFGHEGKAAAIENIHKNRFKYFDKYLKCTDRLEFLGSLPFIGPTTKFHLARNLGMDVCKPDRHLLRISKMFNMTHIDLCDKISKESGDKIGVIDVILWRAGNLLLI